MSKKRNRYSAEQKVVILKRHLVEQAPLSDICDEYGGVLSSLHLSLFLQLL